MSGYARVFSDQGVFVLALNKTHEKASAFFATFSCVLWSKYFRHHRLAWKNVQSRYIARANSSVNSGVLVSSM